MRHPLRTATLAAVLLGCTSATEVAPLTLPEGTLDAVVTATATSSAVTLQLQVTNPQSAPVTLEFSSGQQYDFQVRRPDGAVVWTWSADKVFTAALTSRTLAAGETLTFRETWSPTERGTLIAEERLTSTSHVAAATAGFTIR